jgi:predicted ATPase
VLLARRLLAAQAHAEQAIAPYDLRRYRALGVVSADDGVGVSLVVRAFALQVRGHPDQAEAALQEGVAAARELSLPFALGGALLSTADLHLLRRESRAVREAADVTIDLAAREGFPYYVARATILRGWALADQGEVEAGITEIRRGLAAYDAMGARLWLPCCLGLLAEALGKAGEVDEALGVSAEALETAVRTGEREYEAELHRLRGELTLRKAPARRKSQAGSTHAAEECFQQAITVARRQGAKSFELRAGVSLARSWQRRGETKAAHRMLSEISGRFTEGFETKDWLEAKALLSDSTTDRSAEG